jgi:cytochrome P450
VTDPQKALAAVGELYGAMGAEIAQRRAAPTDDLTSQLIKSQVDGRPMTDPELLGTVFLLLLGGMDTRRTDRALPLRVSGQE